jgi:hypothetical protein
MLVRIRFLTCTHNLVINDVVILITGAHVMNSSQSLYLGGGGDGTFYSVRISL